MISRTSEISDLNKYACMLPKRWKMTALLIYKAANFVNYLLAVISEKMFASYAFPDKNQKPLRMRSMQITKQTRWPFCH